jgi:hypothetical protein
MEGNVKRGILISIIMIMIMDNNRNKKLDEERVCLPYVGSELHDLGNGEFSGAL